MTRRANWPYSRITRAAWLALVGLLVVAAVQRPAISDVVQRPAIPGAGPRSASFGGALPAVPAQRRQPTTGRQEHRIYLPMVRRSQRVFLPFLCSSGSGGRGEAGDLSVPGTEPLLAARAPRGFVTRQGENLQLNGQPYNFVGINVSYLLGTYFPEAQMEEVISFLAANGVQVMRVWVEPRPDLDSVEHMLNLGSKYGVRFIMTLQDFFGQKDGWWFKSTYKTRDLPYIRYIVPRFSERPEVLMWELMNEPTCPGADANRVCWEALYQWAQVTSQEIKRLDPNHLISIGMQHAGFDQRAIDTFRHIHALDTIDIVSVHTEGGRVAKGGRQLERDIAHELGKPIFFGEVYMRGLNKGCQPLSDDVLQRRAQAIGEDIRQSREAGIDGYLLWQYAHCFGGPEGGRGDCFCGVFDYYADDPVWAVLKEIKWAEMFRASKGKPLARQVTASAAGQ